MNRLLRSTAILTLLAVPAFAQQEDTPGPTAEPEAVAPDTAVPAPEQTAPDPEAGESEVDNGMVCIETVENSPTATALE